MSLVNKPKTQKGRRFLAKREGKLEENTKRVMLIRGGKTSETVTQALKDIFVLKVQYAKIEFRSFVRFVWIQLLQLQ